MPIRTNRHAGFRIYGTLGVVSSEGGNPNVAVQHCRADCWGEQILPDCPSSQEDGLGPRPVSQRAGELEGDRPKIP